MLILELLIPLVFPPLLLWWILYLPGLALHLRGVTADSEFRQVRLSLWLGTVVQLALATLFISNFRTNYYYSSSLLSYGLAFGVGMGGGVLFGLWHNWILLSRIRKRWTGVPAWPVYLLLVFAVAESALLFLVFTMDNRDKVPDLMALWTGIFLVLVSTRLLYAYTEPERYGVMEFAREPLMRRRRNWPAIFAWAMPWLGIPAFFLFFMFLS